MRPAAKDTEPLPGSPAAVRLGAMRAHRVVIVGLLLASFLASLVAGQVEWSRQVGMGVPWLRIVALVGTTLVGFSWAATGGVLAWLRHRNPVGWVMLGVGALTQFSVLEETLERPEAFGSAGMLLSLVVGFSLYCLLGLLPAFYPTGRLPGQNWVWPCLVVVAGAALMQWQWLGETTILRGQSPWTAAGGWSWLPGAVLAAGVVAVWTLSVLRVLRGAFPERLQLIWLLGAVIVTIAALFLGDSTTALLVQMLCLYALPVAVAVGIVRYRLLGIENMLRGALVYGILTGTIVAVQVGLAAIAGTQLSGTALPAVVAAGVVAVGLNPVRIRLQSGVDRLVHGRRAEPIHAVSDLGNLVARAAEGELLAEMLAGVRDAVRSRQVCLRAEDGAVVAIVGDGLDVDGVAIDHSAAAPAFRAELTVSGTRVGALEVAGRGAGERFSARDELLLSTMATQVAVVVRAIQLTAELGRERDAVLGATQRERQRLRRDLHDGLGPSLTGVRLGVEAISDALRAGDHLRAEEITGVLRDEMMSTVTEMRRILTDLRPLALAEDGLVNALRHRIASLASTIHLEVGPLDLTGLSQKVEEAAYLVATEALNNVVKHSGASRTTVHLETLDSHLHLCVIDDGAGFPPGTLPGIGMNSMRERARALGGDVEVSTTTKGTTVTLAVPLAGGPR